MSALPDPPSSTPGLSGDWQPLPLRARAMFTITGVFGFLVPALVAVIPISQLAKPAAFAATLAVLSLLMLPLLGAWLARKQYRHTFWKLDGVGFAMRRGRLWHSETCVPTTRVQHLDLKRGPLERRFRLATLVIHTAGTRDHAVTLAGLDEDEAERLRDRLARQVDDEAGAAQAG